MVLNRKSLMKLAGTLILAISIGISLFAGPKQESGDSLQSSLVATSTNLDGNQTVYLVKAVVDGDTVKIEINGQTETLRLIGLDTPETVDPRRPVQCFGREASNKAKWILEGKLVRLEADITQGERDKYGRLLRYLFLEDGTFFNKLMIAEGYAHEYTYQSNPYKYQAEFKAAEKFARENKKGLWDASACGGDTSKAAAPSSTAVKKK